MSLVSKLLKCASCNIVINEVLSFIQNKLNVMDNGSLLNICSTGFTEEEVNQAKILLFDSLHCIDKCISRRKNKIERDIDDIIVLMKNTNTDKIPIFVAKDLHKLPPVNFENVDVTRLLKDIVSLKSEIREIKDKYATTEQLDMFKNEILIHDKTMESSRSHEPYLNINTRRGAYLYDSGPSSLNLNNKTGNESAVDVSERAIVAPVVHFDPLPAPARTPEPPRLPVPVARVERRRAPEQRVDKEPVVYCEDCDDSDLERDLEREQTNMNLKYRSIVTNESENKKSFSKIMRDTSKGEWKNDKHDNDGFTVVQRRRVKNINKFIGNKGSGKSTSNTKFRAADIKVPLFISNVDKDVSENDIVEYILEKTQEKVSLSKIKMKSEKGYNSYKVYVSRSKLAEFLNKDLWPSDISFRRFVVFKEKVDKKVNVTGPSV